MQQRMFGGQPDAVEEVPRSQPWQPWPADRAYRPAPNSGGQDIGRRMTWLQPHPFDEPFTVRFKNAGYEIPPVSTWKHGSQTLDSVLKRLNDETRTRTISCMFADHVCMLLTMAVDHGC